VDVNLYIAIGKVGKEKVVQEDLPAMYPAAFAPWSVYMSRSIDTRSVTSQDAHMGHGDVGSSRLSVLMHREPCGGTPASCATQAGIK
jgi:hypothetical protein